MSLYAQKLISIDSSNMYLVKSQYRYVDTYIPPIMEIWRSKAQGNG